MAEHGCAWNGGEGLRHLRLPLECATPAENGRLRRHEVPLLPGRNHGCDADGLASRPEEQVCVCVCVCVCVVKLARRRTVGASRTAPSSTPSSGVSSGATASCNPATRTAA